MKLRTCIALIVITMAGAMGLAHSGATGDVEKRMAAMSDMQKQVKTLAPIMRGLADYDASAIRAAAETVIAHSGEALTVLFPDGSNAPPSEALNTIWADWDEFARLADVLAVAAEGMKRAADNGLGDPGAGQGSGMMARNQPDATPDADMLADMPVNAGFMAMTQICSQCHLKFRAKRN